MGLEGRVEGDERLMAPEKPLEFSPVARIADRGLTEAHIRYCREHNTLR
ncbi:unnamed protein product, partial [marine sediment metagenome]